MMTERAVFDDEKRAEELQAVRKEAGDMSREEGAQKRPAITMIALVMIVWLILCFFDLVKGRGVTATSAIAVAALTGLCWGTYRETRERAAGWYAVIAGAATLVLMAAHFLGV